MSLVVVRKRLECAVHFFAKRDARLRMLVLVWVYRERDPAILALDNGRIVKPGDSCRASALGRELLQ